MIDLHCHLLAGIDDGPSDIAGSIAMAQEHVRCGVRRVACTPHADWTTPNTPEQIAEGVDELRRALALADVKLDICAGAEVALTYALERSDEQLIGLRLGGSPWLLLEAPLGVGVGVEQAVGMVAMRGHRILLAHPERCPAFHREPAALRRLVESRTVLTQVTASAVDGAFGSKVRRFAEQMLDDGLVHVIASDAHDVDRRSPGLRESAVAARVGSRLDWLVDHIPAAILAGDRIPAVPGPEAPGGGRRRRWLRRD
jgi:protein-tyrosine phosphatase